MSLHAVSRSHDANGLFGPLTPVPLSPSILTLCGGGADPFDRYARGPNGEADPGPLWESFGSIPDMRLGECISPRLPTPASA